jgi:hypothetical protein
VIPTVVKFLETEAAWWLGGVGRRWEGIREGGNGELLFNGYRIPVLQEEKVLEIGSTMV